MTQGSQLTHRPLNEIAKEIRADWSTIGKGVSPYADPYLRAMETMYSITENYHADSGVSVVLYFLSNATTYRGVRARALKIELNAILESVK